MAPKKTTRRTSKRDAAVERAVGFGFLPGQSQHHFVVSLEGGSALISEHLHFDDAEARRAVSMALGREDDKLRVTFPLLKWNLIAEPVREIFNERLRAAGLPAGRWGKSQTPISRLLGKELVLLAWAIEDADPSLIPAALANWQGLAPEERWWLFTMTNAATGHAIQGRNKGWRRAVRFALTENPVAVSGDVQREGLFNLMVEETRARV